MKPSIFIFVLGAATVLLISVFLVNGSTRPSLSWHTNESGIEHRLKAYMSPTCGCCPIHSDYLEKEDYRVEKDKTEDMDRVKQQNQVPDEVLSCHTTVVNDGQYFIEGHVPAEAIQRLLENEPDIAGIGMPGMPSGSPGMAGQKTETFEIMQIDNHGQVSPYMEI